ncbi:ATPase, partial [Micromonospora azadirachtae]
MLNNFPEARRPHAARPRIQEGKGFRLRGGDSMRFSVVEIGYDQRQVDACLDELAIRLTRLAAWAESAAGAGREWDRIRQEATGLCG